MPARSTQQVLLQRIKTAVHALEPDAEVWLYGSHARGNARPDSDWDLLILLSGPVSMIRRETIQRPIYEIEWQTGTVLCIDVRSKEEWYHPERPLTFFQKNVQQEGMRL